MQHRASGIGAGFFAAEPVELISNASIGTSNSAFLNGCSPMFVFKANI